MALLQIAEPGRAAAPHQHRLAVGIDLGTTNSLVATIRSGLLVMGIGNFFRAETHAQCSKPQGFCGSRHRLRENVVCH